MEMTEPGSDVDMDFFSDDETDWTYGEDMAIEMSEADGEFTYLDPTVCDVLVKYFQEKNLFKLLGPVLMKMNKTWSEAVRSSQDSFVMSTQQINSGNILLRDLSRYHNLRSLTLVSTYPGDILTVPDLVDLANLSWLRSLTLKGFRYINLYVDFILTYMSMLEEVCLEDLETFTINELIALSQMPHLKSLKCTVSSEDMSGFVGQDVWPKFVCLEKLHIECRGRRTGRIHLIWIKQIRTLECLKLRCRLEDFDIFALRNMKHLKSLVILDDQSPLQHEQSVLQLNRLNTLEFFHCRNPAEDVFADDPIPLALGDFLCLRSLTIKWRFVENNGRIDPNALPTSLTTLSLEGFSQPLRQTSLNHLVSLKRLKLTYRCKEGSSDSQDAFQNLVLLEELYVHKDDFNAGRNPRNNLPLPSVGHLTNLKKLYVMTTGRIPPGFVNQLVGLKKLQHLTLGGGVDQGKLNMLYQIPSLNSLTLWVSPELSFGRFVEIYWNRKWDNLVDLSFWQCGPPEFDVNTLGPALEEIVPNLLHLGVFPGFGENFGYEIPFRSYFKDAWRLFDTECNIDIQFEN